MGQARIYLAKLDWGFSALLIWGNVRAVANRPLSDFDRAASAWIRSTAGAQKLGQYEVAERANIPINTFRPYWRGDRRIALGDFEVIVVALGAEPEDAMKEIKRIRISGNYSS
jgi:hypothetical protein